MADRAPGQDMATNTNGARAVLGSTVPARLRPARSGAGTSGGERRRRLRPVVALAVLLLGGLLAAVPGVPSATPAGAQTAGRAAVTLTARHANQCLAVAGASTTAGAAVVQMPCSGGLEQSWYSVDAGGGFRQLVSAQSDQCMTVAGASTADSAAIVQQPCVAGATHQQFSFDPATGSPVRIVARVSGKCIDIFGAGTTAGTAAIQWPCHTALNQSFAVGSTTVNLKASGRWSAVIDLPMVPAAGANLTNGKVLLWSAYAKNNFGGDNGFTQALTFDPAAVTWTERQVSNTGHDMFCPGTANLPDGRVLVNGGSSSARTSLYDPAADTWTAGATMNVPRGYQGTTVLSDGSVLTLGGSWSGGLGGKDGEVWTAFGGWRRLTGVPDAPFTGADPGGVYRGDNHLWLFGWKNGRVFHAGPTRAMHWIDTAGNGSVTDAGNRGTDAFAINGNAVMYAPGRILTIGGAPAYNGGAATANATVIDINGVAVTSRAVASMANRRSMHNSVVLPSGEVVVVGGVPVSQPFSDTNPVLATEVWNPTTERFSAGAAMTVPRPYHSFALLQPDGRVLVGGGGLCGTCNVNHPNLQVYTPPYLLNADGTAATQPRIITAPSSVDLAQVFTVTTNTPVTQMALVRLASNTHSVNNDQRRIPLTFTAGAGNLSYEVTAPDDAGVATPGAYMLFALNADGVPSVAKIVTVTTKRAASQPGSVAGTVTNGDGSAAAGVDVDLFAANPDGSRGAFVTAATTDAAGRYQFAATPGSYVLTFIAPAGRTFTNGSQWLQAAATVGSGQAVTGVDARLNGGGATGASIGGTVTNGDGSAAAGVVVDLFAANADGSRGAFVGATSTDTAGRYQFAATAGCYVLTFIAPTGRTFTNGSQWFQPSACPTAGQALGGVNAALSGGGAGGAAVTGTVTAATGGAGVAGVDVDLFAANADGSRGTWIGSQLTDSTGRYRFDVTPGCYVLTFIAPTGRTFTNGSQWFQPSACPTAGQTLAGVNAVLNP